MVDILSYLRVYKILDDIRDWVEYSSLSQASSSIGTGAPCVYIILPPGLEPLPPPCSVQNVTTVSFQVFTLGTKNILIKITKIFHYQKILTYLLFYKSEIKLRGIGKC